MKCTGCQSPTSNAPQDPIRDVSSRAALPPSLAAHGEEGALVGHAGTATQAELGHLGPRRPSPLLGKRNQNSFENERFREL